MNYYYLHNARLDVREISTIIQSVNLLELKDGLIGNKNKDGDKGTKIRSGKVCFLDDLQVPSSVWVKLNNLLVSSKKENPEWNVSITGTQPLQYGEYREGDHYDWHADQTVPYEGTNTIRQLSVVVSLNDPEDYEGGEFEYKTKHTHTYGMTTDTHSVKHPKGTMIMFPSFVEHRVAPVTSGVRRSLTGWYVGNHLGSSSINMV